MTPRPPRDSTFTPARVPAVWPTPALVMPMVKGSFSFRFQPFAPGGNAPVAHRREYRDLPSMPLWTALMTPEQSEPWGPTPPQTYGLPSWLFAKSRAFATLAPPTA